MIADQILSPSTGGNGRNLLAWAHQIAAAGLFLATARYVSDPADEELAYVGLAQPWVSLLINSFFFFAGERLSAGGQSTGATTKAPDERFNATRRRRRWRQRYGSDFASDVSGIPDGKGQRIAEMIAAKAEQLIEQAHYRRQIVRTRADAARTLAVR